MSLNAAFMTSTDLSRWGVTLVRCNELMSLSYKNLSSRVRFLSKSLIWKQKSASRDPGVKVRILAPGSRHAPFSTPGPLVLGKIGGRDDNT